MEKEEGNLTDQGTKKVLLLINQIKTTFAQNTNYQLNI